MHHLILGERALLARTRMPHLVAHPAGVELLNRHEVGMEWM